MAIKQHFDTATDAVLPLGIPEKFLADGTVQPFPGNTIICHIPQDSPTMPALHTVYDAYVSHPIIARYVRLLPPESWHMTVFDGARERESEPGMWPEDFEKPTLSEATVEFGRRLRAVGPQLESQGLAPPYHMRVCGFEKAQCGMGLDVEGATAEEEARMRRLRDVLADCLGFRAPNHDRYRFHITIAYLLSAIGGDDKKEMLEWQEKHLPLVCQTFDLGRLEFCVFEDMEAFSRQFYV